MSTAQSVNQERASEDTVVTTFVIGSSRFQFAHECRRRSVDAEDRSRSFGWVANQRQRQVLPSEKRLAVEPGLRSIPALDRGRVEDVLAQRLQ